ncbi:MAG: TatD family hydrolase [Puniceicoccales bacterium]|jgi:TatD DNase family protein|nr:TatD family hydrolase [Puniceicoccales bacterium]
MLIDSHCHLESFVRANALDEVLGRAAAAGVGAMICVGTEPGDWSVYRDLAADHPGCLYHTVGLHPCSVDEGWRDALAGLCGCFADAVKPVALGEIGLDYFHLPKEAEAQELVKARQLAAFREQLAIAARLGVAVVIHSREAFGDCVREIDASGVDWARVVFHCFGKGAGGAAELNRRGGRASFTGTLTYPKAENVREALLAQGVERLMLETDSPYLSPQAVRGQRNEPAHLRYVAEAAASLLELPLEELAARTVANTRQFFAL